MILMSNAENKRMGKDKTGKIVSDAFQRINYLFQAAYLVLKETPHNVELARHYVHTLRVVAKRQVLRIHPDIKRVLCKKCSMLLIPGVTAKMRKKGRKEKHVVVTCTDCGTIKRFPTRAAYTLWMDRAEAWVNEQQQQQQQQQSKQQPKQQQKERQQEQPEQKITEEGRSQSDNREGVLQEDIST